MKKFLTVIYVFLYLFAFGSCTGTPVIYNESCDCPEYGSSSDNKENFAQSLESGELMTGMALVTTVDDSTSASYSKDGEIKYEVTMVSVLVDGDGIIRDCVIDGISASVSFDYSGKITGNTDIPLQTKNELGDNYGMVKYGGAIAEWYKQAEALASFAVGKSAYELRRGAVDETGKAPEGSQLASSATIYLGGYVDAIEEAVNNAKKLGAKSGDTFHMTACASLSDSNNADVENEGNSQLDVTVASVSMNNNIITSCIIDGVSAKIAFDENGAITSDISAPIKTKTQLGADYGMVIYGGAIAEWYEQAEDFSAYITGKTPDEVENIAVNEHTAPTDADIASSVTIAIGDFKLLIKKVVK